MAANAATIQIRIDEETKNQALEVLNNLHINLSDAIKMYLRQIVLTKSIPLRLWVPNELTAKTIADAQAGKDLHEVANVDELFKELDN